MHFTFEHFYRHDEMATWLQTAESRFPNLCRIESIGKSLEGRDLWLAKITNYATGSDRDKPAIYVDGNIHAGEVTANSVCLYLIHQLVTRWGCDEAITHILDTRTVYVLPRVNPDGAEVYLTTPHMLRSSTRLDPEYRLETNHLYPEDINGDGEILFMRIEDPTGSHRISDLDPRLMVPRGPCELEGPFFRIYPEGKIHQYDGGEIKLAPSPWNIDSNRNFPAGWSPTQAGAGKYPLSEPETRAIADFILDHPNISIAHSYHTKGGIFLRPSCSRPDDEMDPFDVATMEALGELGTEFTGYPMRCAYYGFKVDRGSPKYGVFLDWLYEHLGLIGYITELWNKYARAGIDRDSWPHGTPVPEDKQLKLLEWHDQEKLDSFVDWHVFDHPQLGEVEIGGFHFKTFQQNVPFKLLQDECERNVAWCLEQAAATPRIVISGVDLTRHNEVITLRVHIRNEGFLPTNITNQALKVEAVKDVTACIEGEGFEVIAGDQRQELGQIDGYTSAARGFTGGADGYGPPPVYGHRCVEWAIRASEGSSAIISVTSDRAGTVKRQVKLA